MGRLTPQPDPPPDDDQWITALYPVVCALHHSPIPRGADYRLDDQKRRICKACWLLQNVIGQPLEDPREGTT